MTQALHGRRIAILATNGVEEVELTGPRDALRKAGAMVQLVSLEAGTIQSMYHDVEQRSRIAVDLVLAETRPDDFHALVLPGGTLNPDTLRIHEEAVAFVRHFVTSGKPVAAICHGPWMLLEAGGVHGRRIASWPSLKTDLRNAGAEWVDESCVVDGPIVTSRNPRDLPDFNRAMVEVFGAQRAES